MADPFVFPFEAAMIEVATALVPAGRAPHYLGKKYLAQNDAPPRYVWVPDRSTKQKAPTGGGVEDHDVLDATVEFCDVFIWGKSWAQAWAMRNNLIREVRKRWGILFKIASGRWPRPGESIAQLGECCVVTLSYDDQIIDELIDIETLLVESPRWVIPTAMETEIVSANPDEEPGELFEVVTT